MATKKNVQITGILSLKLLTKPCNFLPETSPENAGVGIQLKVSSSSLKFSGMLLTAASPRSLAQYQDKLNIGKLQFEKKEEGREKGERLDTC